MVEPFGSRGHFKPFEKVAVFPEEMEKLTEMLVLYLPANFNETLEHLINISFSHGKEVRGLNGIFFDSFDMGDIELEMLLERDCLPFHMDEIILLKGFDKELHRGPDPTFHFPGTIDELQFQVDISSFGDAGRFFFDQKEGVHMIILFDLVNIGLHQIPLKV
jgi:hypothetical protein